MVLTEIESNMQKSVEASQRNFNTIRTGRANTSLLDRLTVEYYGADTPLKALATISTPDSQTISIQPFDISTLALIEKAISISDLGFTPNNDGKIIRINIPPLTEERRLELVKQAKAEAEQCKISIRNVRQKANDEVKKLGKDGLSEDMVKDAESEVQKITDSFIQKTEDRFSAKEKEILTI